jgi:hypothetical protein
MGEEAEAARLAATGRWKKCRKVPRKVFGALKFPVAALFFIGYFLFSEFPKSQADELLRRLTTLSRQGANALCNPKRIEDHLSIQFRESSITRNASQDFSSLINSKDEFLSGSYSKFQAGQQTVCKLQLRMVGQRFCDTDSARAQRLVGRRLQHQLAVPGEPGFYDHGYELVQDATQRTVLGWREPGRACPVDVEIVAAMR